MDKDAKTETNTDPQNTLTRDEITKMITETVNAALSTHATRLKGALMKDVTETVTSAIKPLAEQLTTATAPKEPTETDATDPKTQEAIRRAELAAAKRDKEIEQLKAQYAASEKAREEERQSRMTQEERTALANALTAAGCTGSLLKGAMALLYDAEKKVARNEKGEIGLKSMTPVGETVVPLEEGLGDWFKTDDGKAYLPPRPAQGAGNTAGLAARGNSQPTREELLAQLGIEMSRITG